MAVKHCVWHEASPAEQPFDSASLPLRNNVLHVRCVTQQEARYLNRQLLMWWLITYFQAWLIPVAFQYIYHKMQSGVHLIFVCIQTEIILFYRIIISLNRILAWVHPLIMCSILNPEGDTKIDKDWPHENRYNRFTDQQQIRNVHLKHVVRTCRFQWQKRKHGIDSTWLSQNDLDEHVELANRHRIMSILGKKSLGNKTYVEVLFLKSDELTADPL